MEQKQVFAIGDRVEQMCVKCGEERGHMHDAPNLYQGQCAVRSDTHVSPGTNVDAFNVWRGRSDRAH